MFSSPDRLCSRFVYTAWASAADVSAVYFCALLANIHSKSDSPSSKSEPTYALPDSECKQDSAHIAAGLEFCSEFGMF